ncbi:DNA-3-methyladenine glycosylase [Patescibacteria group bacterium]|nr:DNA-3-methyladenine glycosylase [Patescibacteria group bacterium]
MLKNSVILSQQFFARPTLVVAKDLIGKILVRKLSEGIRRYRITEVEAYCGVSDLACHTSKGRTKRTEIMFGPAGYIYVYLIYGMHYCLNFVTAGEDQGEAVLIRAVEPLFNTTNSPIGPGRLCKYLQIDKSLNSAKLGRGTGLWVEEDNSDATRSVSIKSSPRRGIAYAKNYAKKPWRFYLKDNRFVS